MTAQAMPLLGIHENEHLHEHWVRRDTRPWLIKYASKLGSIAPYVMAAFALLVLAFPSYTDLILGIGLFARLILASKVPSFPIATPMRKKWPWSSKTVGDGIQILGTELGTGRIICQSSDQARQHQFLMGTTGSGKTRTVLSHLFSGSIVWGGGGTIVDGKGDSLTFWLLYRMCRRMDRTDDLMVINFLNGGQESGNRASPVTRMSNTTNSWSSATSDAVAEMLSGLMASGGGDGDYWRGRARTMVSTVIRLLVAMRNRGEIVLDVQTLREHLPLEQLVRLAKRDDFRKTQKAGLMAYLYDLGVSEQEIELFGTDQQLDFSPKAVEQHGYNLQQLTEALGMMADSFRHIFGVRFGEVDWKSCLYRKKIVFVLLPALEKSPDSISSLGRLIFAAIRSALSPALGDVLEGSYDYVMSRKIADSPIPYFLYFDEYGAYAQPGNALFATMCRGLGISVVFASQDEPGMRKSQEMDREVKSIIGSTNTKICMRIEEMKDTYEVFSSGAGKARIAVQDGDRRDNGGFFKGYYNEGTTKIEERDRVNERDLKNQEAGEAHLMWKDQLLRCKLLWIDPPSVPYARINQWMDLLPNSELELKQSATAASGKLFDKKTLAERHAKHVEQSPAMHSESIRDLFSAYREGMELSEGSPVESGIFAIARLVSLHNEDLDSIREQIDAGKQEVEDRVSNKNLGHTGTQTELPISNIHAADQPQTPPQARLSADVDDESPIPEEPTTAQSGQSSTTPDTVSEQPLRREVDSEQLARDVAERQAMFMSALQGSVSDALSSVEDLTPAERQILGVDGQLKRAQEFLDVEDREADLERSLSTLRETTPDYPVPPTPERISKDSLESAIADIKSALDARFGPGNDDA